MIDLQECRNEIDKIDSDIIRLFEQRMKVCEDVAEYKIRTGKKVLDPERERQKLEVLRGKAHGEFNLLMGNSMNLVRRSFFSRSWRSAVRDSISFSQSMESRTMRNWKW